MAAKTASTDKKKASTGGSGKGKISLASIVKEAYSKNPTLKEIADLDALDTLMLGALTSKMPLKEVLKSWDLLRTQFVDWNEIRISSASEVAENFPKAEAPLELAVQIKEMLSTLYERRHQVSLEFIRENTLPETREFFKRSPDLPDLCKLLVLAAIKEQPVIPMEKWAQGGLIRAGLLSESKTSTQRQKDLFDELGEVPLVHAVMALHDEAFRHPDPAIELAKKKKLEAEKLAAKKAAEAARKEAARIAAAEKKAAAEAKKKAAAEKKAAAAAKKAAEAAKKKAAAEKKKAAEAKKKAAEAKKKAAAAKKKAAADKKKAAAAKKKAAADKKKAAAAKKKKTAKKKVTKKKVTKKKVTKKTVKKAAKKKVAKKTAKKTAKKKVVKKAAKKTAKKTAKKKTGKKQTR